MKNKKVVYAIIGMIALVLVTIGLTYAYWLVTRTQQGENVINTGCLDISLSNEVNDITLTNQFPMSDEDGKKLTPYEFTVTNNCANSVDYQINLESLETGTEELNDNSIKMAINLKGETNIVGTKLSSKGTTDTTIENALNARKLLVGTLGASSDTSSDDEVTYELRLWLDANAPISEMNKAYKSKITVTVAPTINVDVWDGTSATALADLEINESAKTVNVNSAADLAGVRNAINAGELDNYTIELKTNIDLNNMAWEPIGSDGTGEHGVYDATASYFSGTINGNGNTISNLNVVSEDEAGFIKAVDGDTTIRDLNLEGGNVTATGESAGALIAYALEPASGTNVNLTIENVNANVDVKGTSTAGGIVGRAYNMGDTIIRNCTNSGNVEGPGASSGKVAGILGYFKGHTTTSTDPLEYSHKVLIENCTNYGTISNAKQTGGVLSLTATNGGALDIINCTNYGTIENSDYAGGIVGVIDRPMIVGEVTNCVNNGTISGNIQAGGLMAQFHSRHLALSNCVNNGSVSVNTNGTYTADLYETKKVYAGGLFGTMGGDHITEGKYLIVSDCTNNGTVTGNGYFGGIAGYAAQYTIINCINNVEGLEDIYKSVNYVTPTN